MHRYAYGVLSHSSYDRQGPVLFYSPTHTHFMRSVYVLVIRRKDDGLTDIVSNEARRAEFDTISVRPSSFRRISIGYTP